MTGGPHLIYLAVGFPPAAKSSAYRMRAVANAFAGQGWDVTAVSLADESWFREMGLDPSLLEGLSPRIRRVGVDLARYDLATDIREYSEDQALHWDAWLADQIRLDQEVFPEDIFGRWLAPLEAALADGSMQRLLRTHVMFKDAFDRAQLKNRRVIGVDLPEVTEGFRNIDKKWWLKLPSATATR